MKTARTFGLAFAAVTAALVIATIASPPALASRPASQQLLPPPLATSLVTSAGTWVAIPMGERGLRLNTFWQLFELPTGANRWQIKTPPGIASNGGLVLLNGAAKSIVVGVLPSNLLRFTPTLTLDSRKGWSESGIIPGALVEAADAFAATTTARFALVSKGEGTVLRSDNAGSSWSNVTNARSLSSVAGDGACEVSGIGDVATSANGTLFVGTGCSKGDIAGIFSLGSPPHLVGPKMVSLSGGGSRAVIRLASQGGALVALVETLGRVGGQVVATMSANGVNWTTSSALSFGSGARVVSAGPAIGEEQFVVWKANRLEAAVSTKNGNWSLLPALPAGTEILAFPSPRRVDAFAVNRSTLVDWQLAASGSNWRRAQTIDVPIIYGSSG